MHATTREDPYHDNAPVINAISASQHLPPGGDATKDLNIQQRSQTHQDIQLITQPHKGSGLIR